MTPTACQGSRVLLNQMTILHQHPEDRNSAAGKHELSKSQQLKNFPRILQFALPTILEKPSLPPHWRSEPCFSFRNEIRQNFLAAQALNLGSRKVFSKKRGIRLVQVPSQNVEVLPRIPGMRVVWCN